MRQCTLYNCTSIDLSGMFNTGEVGAVGDVAAVAVAIPPGEQLAAAGDAKPANRENSIVFHASISSSSEASETIQWTVDLLHQLLSDMIQEFLIKAVLIFERLCRYWLRTRWMDPSAITAADIMDLVGLHLLCGGMNILSETMNSIREWIIIHMISVSCIPLTLFFTSWTKLWQDTTQACFMDRQTIMDCCCGENNECGVEFINQQFLWYSHSLYAIEAYPLDMIYNFTMWKANLTLLNWSST